MILRISLVKVNGMFTGDMVTGLNEEKVFLHFNGNFHFSRLNG